MDELYQRLYDCAEYRSNCNKEDVEAGFCSSNPYHVWMACKIAGASRMAQHIDDLIDCVTAQVGEQEPDVTSVAVWALAKIGGPQVDQFWKAAALSNDPETRRIGADLIGEMKNPEGLPVLAGLLSDPDNDVVKWSALALSKFGPLSLPILSKALSETSSLPAAVAYVDAIHKISASKANAIVRESVAGRSDDFKTQVLSISGHYHES